MFYTEDEFKNKIYTDPRFKDMGALPSQFAPYAKNSPELRLKNLFVRPFELPELNLMSRAAKLNEITHLIRAVDLVISHPVHDLTIPDFYYVLAWLRTYSRPQTPYLAEWTCNQPFFEHKETRKALFYSMPDSEWPQTTQELHDNYDVSVCGANNVFEVKLTNLTVTDLQPEDFELADGFDFPRVAHMQNIEDGLKDPEWALLVGGIQWIAGATWADKVAKANKDPELVYLGMAINDKVNYGVSESVKLPCNKCRHEHIHELELNAISFFQ